MTDRELLEAAARAAGLGEVWYLNGSDTPYVGPRYELGQPVRYRIFQPLTDDGDALRLAVKLRMMIDDIPGGYMAGHIVAVCEGSNMHDRRAEYELRDPCPYAATRRAIVRAAAAIDAQKGAA